MAEIALTRGFVAQVDEADAAFLSQWNWCAQLTRDGGAYAVRCATGSKTIYMHRLLLDALPGQMVDHINRDTLDNRRQNIRLCSRSQNCANARAGTGTKGTYYMRKSRGQKLWHARIQVNGKKLSLGVYHTQEEAARAYDAAAKIHHGEFAALNFPEAA